MPMPEQPDGVVPCGEYSAVAETRSILEKVRQLVTLPPEIDRIAREDVQFVASGHDKPFFPIPFKETELGSALKAIEASFASALAQARTPEETKGHDDHKVITVSLERTTAFLFQTYLATVRGLGKLDEGVKKYLKDTDLLQAQSDPYRRLSANLYETSEPGKYYHIHGSLEATTTLGLLGLKPFDPDLSKKGHDAIVAEIESRVKMYTVEELEDLNARAKQAGIMALTQEEFRETPHGQENVKRPPWTIDQVEDTTPPCALPRHQPQDGPLRPLAGIKVLELSRIIAGPVIGRILAEYGADVLKITSPYLSDVPFFQVDGNMGKRAAELDLKSAEGRARFEDLLEDADVVLDGYRPGAIDKLGYGPAALSGVAKRRGKGFVYVNENCFGYAGEWRNRPGWQQIADCVSGLAWEQGRFMGLNEPVVPPFPISDYGTGCIGAIAALTGLYNRTKHGGSWHGKVSLLHYDLLLMSMGAYSPHVQRELLEFAGEDFKDLRHSHSVDQISGTALRALRKRFPGKFEAARSSSRKGREEESDHLCEGWFSRGYNAEIVVVQPVVRIEGVEISFKRPSRPNGTDVASWEFEDERDCRLDRSG